ncbi:hypothetical protein ACFLTS_05145 [Chloroflexota bacterium]
MADRKKMGRPSKLTPKLMKSICGFIRNGNYVSTSCQAVGIHPQTYRNWLQQGDNDIMAGIGSIHADFVQAIGKAEAEDEIRRVANISKAGETNWVADMTFLERKNPEKWGRKERRDNVDSQEVTFNIVHVDMDRRHETESIVEGEAKELLEEGKGRSQNS